MLCLPAFESASTKWSPSSVKAAWEKCIAGAIRGWTARSPSRFCSAKRLFESLASTRVAWPNKLLFVRDGALLAQPFDLGRLELSGEPILIANEMPFTSSGRLGVSASRSVVLVLASAGLAGSPYQTAWVDRTGRDLAPPSVIVGYGRSEPKGQMVWLAASVTSRPTAGAS